MPTTPIAGPGSQSTPVTIRNTYQEPITPLTASAIFDGTAAAGDFIPCLSFYTQDGRLMGRYKGEATVTAGDTAQETFAPFLRRSGGGGSTVFESASYSGNNVNIASGATGTITWDSFDAGDDLLDLSVPGAPAVRTAGFYIVTSLVICGTGGISFRQAFNFVSAGPGSAGVGLTGDLSGLGATGHVTLTLAAILSAGDTLSTTVLNQGGIAANFFQLQGSVVRIAST